MNAVDTMKKHTRTSKRGGFTLIEVMIGVTVMALFLGAVGMVTLSAQGVYEQGISSASLEARARRAVQRIASELTAAVAASITPRPEGAMGGSEFTFRTSMGFVGPVQQWSSTSRIQLRPDPRDANDGIDNDSDGLIDERQIVLVRDVGLGTETEAVICGGVRELLEGETANLVDENGNGLLDEPGLSFLIDDNDTLMIRLTLEARDPNNLVVMRTVQTSVHLRN
jgi:prepilin-type N-terminal cleavage/methylation domain-containing protein